MCASAAYKPLPTQLPQVRRVVALQTDAFHSPAPLAALNGMTRRFFEAEVLSGQLTASGRAPGWGIWLPHWEAPRALGMALGLEAAARASLQQRSCECRMCPLAPPAAAKLLPRSPACLQR